MNRNPDSAKVDVAATGLAYPRITTTLVVLIALLAGIAAATGIFSNDGPGPRTITSFRGEMVRLHGYGVYQDMSWDVAVQGIAQDYITLFAAVPLLLLSLVLSRQGSLRGRIALAGILLYFLLTYLFYLNLAVFNSLFLVWTALLGLSFFALALVVLPQNLGEVHTALGQGLPRRLIAVYMITNPSLIALLWLSTVLPPLLSGTAPAGIAHYTTMVVQGLDLALFLPAAFLSGVLFWRRRPVGSMMTAVYLVFLCLLMAALLAKLTGMALVGVSIVPQVFIIAPIWIVAAVLAVLVLRRLPTAGAKTAVP